MYVWVPIDYSQMFDKGGFAATEGPSFAVSFLVAFIDPLPPFLALSALAKIA